MDDNILTQIGLVVLIGLAAMKNNQSSAGQAWR
jgi:hypothetical protein